MGLSSLIRIDKDYTDRLFFDQYRYCLKIRMKDFSCLRAMRKSTKTHWDVADAVVKNQINRSRYGYFGTFDQLVNHKESQGDLLDLLDFLWPFKDDIRPTFSGDWGYIYANSVQILQTVANKPYTKAYYIREAVVSKPKNTIVLDSPQHQYRSFLKEVLLTDVQRTQLYDYLKRIENVRIGPGLEYWLQSSNGWRRNWTRRYYFFDHNDPNIEMMLRLILPQIIRQTWPIIAK